MTACPCCSTIVIFTATGSLWGDTALFKFCDYLYYIPVEKKNSDRSGTYAFLVLSDAHGGLTVYPILELGRWSLNMQWLEWSQWYPVEMVDWQLENLSNWPLTNFYNTTTSSIVNHLY